MPQDEAAKLHSDYPQFAQRMTAEAVAACEGALAAGATEIVVRDAHGSGRNILQEQLPREAKLIRGWSGHPYANILGGPTLNTRSDLSATLRLDVIHLSFRTAGTPWCRS